MHIEAFRNLCLSLDYVEEEFPFGPQHLVFKVGSKMFAMTDLSKETFKVNLKCEPEKAWQQRAQYDEIEPGFHMNKNHWNTVNFEGNLSDAFLTELIQTSYDLVYKGLTKKVKQELKINIG